MSSFFLLPSIFAHKRHFKLKGIFSFLFFGSIVCLQVGWNWRSFCSETKTEKQPIIHPFFAPFLIEFPIRAWFRGVVISPHFFLFSSYLFVFLSFCLSFSLRLKQVTRTPTHSQRRERKTCDSFCNLSDAHWFTWWALETRLLLGFFANLGGSAHEVSTPCVK